MPYGKTTIEVYRPCLTCPDCGYEPDRTTGKCADLTHTAPLEMSDEGCLIEVEVAGRFSTYVPAKVHGDPDDCYDAYGGELEDFEAEVDGKPFLLTDDEEKRAVEACAEESANDDGGYDGPDYDYDDYRW